MSTVRSLAHLCFILPLVLLVSCAAPKRDVPPLKDEAPAGVWHEAPPPVEPTLGPSGIDPASLDRHLSSYLGRSVDPAAPPAGCASSWVPLPYGYRYQALGCTSFVTAGETNVPYGSLSGELALQDDQIVGVILAHFVPDSASLVPVADHLLGYYSRQASCQCTRYSGLEYDCVCPRYQLRVAAGAQPRPKVSVFYYSDGIAFNAYWEAAAEWSRRGRAAVPETPVENMEETPTPADTPRTTQPEPDEDDTDINSLFR